ncbi:MAG: T9SS type A sorting domain-containing protein, partial [Ignavibacteriaceae bacterium]
NDSGAVIQHWYNSGEIGNCIGFAIASTQHSYIGPICGDAKRINIDEAYAKKYWMSWGFYDKYDFNNVASPNDILIWDTEPQNVDHALLHAAVVTSVGYNSIAIKYIYEGQLDTLIHTFTLNSDNNYEEPGGYGRPNYIVRWTGQKTYGYAITVKTSFNSGSVKVDGLTKNIYSSSGTLVPNLSRGSHSLYADETQYNGNEPVGYQKWVDKSDRTIESYPTQTATINLNYNNGFGERYTATYGPIYQVSFQNQFVNVGNGGSIKVNDTLYNSPTSTFNVTQGNTITATAQDQTINGIKYGFDHWSIEGGTASYYTFHPDQNRTYTAYFIGKPSNEGRNLSANSVINQPVILSWNDNINSNVTYYQIWRYSKNPSGTGTYEQIATVNRGIQTYTDYDFKLTSGYTDYLLKYDARGYYSIENTFADPDYSIARFGTTLEKSNANNDTLSTKTSNYEIYCYPNPFNPTTTITYSIKEPGLVTIKVFDLTGQEVANLVNEEKEAGSYFIKFDASELPSGIYIYKIDAGNFTQSQKMLLIK